MPSNAFPSDSFDVLATDARPCSGCVSCVGAPLYACVISQGQMSDAIQVGILSVSKDGKGIVLRWRAASLLCIERIKHQILGTGTSIRNPMEEFSIGTARLTTSIFLRLVEILSRALFYAISSFYATEFVLDVQIS